MERGKRDWRAIQIPLDEIEALSEEERCYRLSDQAVSVLLSLSEYAFWKPRWETSEPLTDAQRDWIDALASYIQSRLMDPNFCEEEDMMDVRQNEENPCILEKSTNGGATWTPWADLSLCMPTLVRNPNTGRYDWTTDGITFYHFPEGAWVDNAPETPVFGLPRPRVEAEEEVLCAAAASAAYIMRHTYAGIGENLLESIAASDFERASSIGFYLTTVETLTGLAIPAIPLTIAVFAGLFATGTGFHDNPLDDDDEERLKCILVSHATNTAGSVTFDWQAVWNDIDLDDPKQDHVRLMMSVLGADFLNYAGAAADAGADCECLEECQYVEHFTGGLKATTYKDPDGPSPYVNPWTGGEWSSSEGGTYRTTAHEDAYNRQQFCFYIDLEADCEISDIKARFKNGEAGYHNWNIYVAMEAAGGSHSDLNWSNHDPSDWTEWHIENPGVTARYIHFLCYDINSGVDTVHLLIDDIQVNIL